MCYKRPGPRCSSHAAARMASAQRELLIFNRSNKDVDEDKKDFKEYERLKKRFDSACKEYDITSSGIKALEREAKKFPEKGGYSVKKFEDAKRLRKARLEAIKAKDIGDIQHKSATGVFDYSKQELSQNEDTLEPILLGDKDIDVTLADSTAWAHKLTHEEITAVRWYSQELYAHVNGSLVNSNYSNSRFVGKHYNPEQTQKVIALLDSALAKSERSTPVVVYRRHTLFTPEGNFSRIGLTGHQEMFKVGSVYKPGFFLSTSLNPDNAPSNNDGPVFFEIKTRKAVSLSAIASQGANEQEFLLPRTSEYKVVGNTNKVVINAGKGKRELTVIQLEEL